MSALTPCPVCSGRGVVLDAYGIPDYKCETCKGRGSVPVPGTCCTGYHQGRGHDGTCTARFSRAGGS